jgi:hypothetical protein
MPRNKKVPDQGGLLNIPDEKIEEKKPVIEVSYTEARKLLPKKEMSDKQKEAVKKLVELNKQKWDEKKKLKEEAELKKKEEVEKVSTKVIVKPKRIYKTKSKTPVNTDDSDSEDELIQKKKHKQKYISETEDSDSEDEKVNKYNKINKEVNHKKKILSKIYNVIKEVKKSNNSSYLDKISIVWE